MQTGERPGDRLFAAALSGDGAYEVGQALADFLPALPGEFGPFSPPVPRILARQMAGYPAPTRPAAPVAPTAPAPVSPLAPFFPPAPTAAAPVQGNQPAATLASVVDQGQRSRRPRAQGDPIQVQTVRPYILQRRGI